MKNIKTFIFIIMTATLGLAVSGCSMLNKVQDASAEKISSLIERYCQETDETFRADLRERINLKLNGQATVKVDCTQQIGENQYGGDRSTASPSNWRGHTDLLYRVSFVATERPNEATRVQSVWRPEGRKPEPALIARHYYF